MKKILIVDDEPFMRTLLEQVLEEFKERGVELLTADNGNAGLEIIRDRSPDLVFLDVMLPGLDGFGVCDAVKNKLGMKGVFIVLLTAKGQESDKKKGVACGADLYITKPFDPEEIIRKTAEILGL